jgi:hypothetical protein
MIRQLLFCIAGTMLVLPFTGCRNGGNAGVPAAAIQEEVPVQLPFNELRLLDLTSFQTTGTNWSVAGEVSSDYTKELDLTTRQGTGVLVNQPQPSGNHHIRTTWQHGDLEIRFDAMLPRGSNSGVYFQGRYEIQLFDSWGKDDPSFADMGGIYQRWDDQKPNGQQGSGGRAPAINASKAPGLWHHFHVLFRAPRFDQDGRKIRNAKFEYVYLNGHLIHQNEEIEGPTRAHQEENEAPLGPLYFQGDHGPVAFRNICYKTYGQDTLLLSRIAYQWFDGKYDYLPDFDTLTPVKTGIADNLSLDKITDQPEGFAVVFNGTLQVPVEGDYLFETHIDDGGELWIDSQLVVHNVGEPGWGSARGLIHLNAGSHPLTMTYYQEVWSSRLLIYYEGPEISRRLLATERKKEPWEIKMEKQPLLTIDKPDRPEMLRSFVMIGPEKLTHAISVGGPLGIHYTYDLLSGALVQCWKGGFTNVTDMWQGRGESQLLQPLSPAILPVKSFPLAQLKSPESPWPESGQKIQCRGYRIDEQENPVFRYTWEELNMEDRIVSHTTEKLTRTVSMDHQPPEDTYVLLAKAPKITRLINGLYSVDGQYYLELSEDDLIIRHQNGNDELLAHLNDHSFSYNLLW